MATKVTLAKIPKPDIKKPCQDLLQYPGVDYGWLRRKRPIHDGTLSKIKFLESVLSKISWDRKFVVLHAGCMYVYKTETEKAPEKAFSLFGYTQVLRAGEVKVSKDVPWTFKVVFVLDETGKVHYFGATSEHEMMKWMRNIKKQMVLANHIDLSEDCITDEDINDLETPISTCNYFDNMQNISDIRKDMDSDSDLESEYLYIDGDNADKFSAKESSCPDFGSKYDDDSLSNKSRQERQLPQVPKKREPPSVPQKKVPATPPKPEQHQFEKSLEKQKTVEVEPASPRPMFPSIPKKGERLRQNIPLPPTPTERQKCSVPPVPAAKEVIKISEKPAPPPKKATKNFYEKDIKSEYEIEQPKDMDSGIKTADGYEDKGTIFIKALDRKITRPSARVKPMVKFPKKKKVPTATLR